MSGSSNNKYDAFIGIDIKFKFHDPIPCVRI